MEAFARQVSMTGTHKASKPAQFHSKSPPVHCCLRRGRRRGDKGAVGGGKHSFSVSIGLLLVRICVRQNFTCPRVTRRASGRHGSTPTSVSGNAIETSVQCVQMTHHSNYSKQ